MDLLSHNYLTDLLDKALECPVCLEPLDATARVLPCQHTFCRRCLLEIVHSRRELLCPECRVQCDIKVDELPPNILLIRLLEGIKSNRRNDRSDSHNVNDLLNFVPQNACPPPLAVGSVHQFLNNQQLNQTLQQSPQQSQNQCQTQSQQSSVKQIVSTPSLLPRAKALYNYEGKELEGDLSFKKGDIIILRKRIDQNWFHGEHNGKSGFLPASYVQVLVAPPSPLPPQCKALYDFRVTDVEEKDCLSFAKSDVITVIRRVDENWAEGKLMDRIGIFPISFVEMNTSAKALMKLASINTNTPSRCAPPAPIISSPEATTSGAILSTPTTTTVSDESRSQSPISSTSSPSSASCTLSSTPTSNSSSSKAITNPPVIAVIPVTISGPVVQSSSLINTSNTIPSQSSADPSLLLLQRSDSNSNNGVNQKRHSLCSASPPGLAPIHQRSQSHIEPKNHSQQFRHSMEILSSPEEDESNQWSTEFARTAVIRKSICRENSYDLQNSSTNDSNQVSQLSAVPVYYMALYNYKPQKLDELELKKGELYSVSEKCHDGWYKGVSVRNGSSGVFPGNYVQLAKSSLPLAQYQCPVNASSVQSRISAKPSQPNTEQIVPKEPPIPKPKPSLQSKPSITLSSNLTSIETSITSSSQPNTADNNTIVYARPRPSGQAFYDISRNINSLVPPPPPSQRPARPVSSILVPNNKPNEESTSPQTQLAQAMNQSLLISKQQSASQSSLNQSTQWHQPKVAATRNTISMINSSSIHSAATAITPPNVSVMSSTTPTTHKPPTDRKETKPKEKSNFIKRFTSSKPKRKQQLSPVFNNNNTSNNNIHNNNISFSCDNPSFVDTSPSLAPIHIRSGSCPNESLADFSIHRKQSSFDDSNTVIKNKTAKATQPKAQTQQQQPIAPPLVRERFRCVVPYPPNSEYELELQMGDIVYVHKKRDDGWFKGTLQRTGKTGLFPGPFVESF